MRGLQLNRCWQMIHYMKNGRDKQQGQVSPHREKAKENTQSPTLLSFFLIEEFCALCLVAAIDSLQAANQMLKRECYRWQLVTHDGQSVASSSGLRLDADLSMGRDFATDYLFVCADRIQDPPYRKQLYARLHQFARKGVSLGALSSGAFILARAGLLDGYSCTLHWKHETAFREEFPDIEYRPSLYAIDRGRLTDSGGIASMEMMLRIVERDHGAEFSQEVANQLHLESIRGEQEIQRSGLIAHVANMPAPVRAAVRLMLENFETPLNNAQLASGVGTSIRKLERMFRDNLQTSPARYYMKLRLQRARELLQSTRLSTLDVALQTGFSSSSYFARCFQKEFERRPSEIRGWGKTGSRVR